MRIHRVGVILACHFHLAGIHVLNRVVAAAVSVLHLIGHRAVSQGDYLMSQTDTEDGQLSLQFFYQFHNRLNIRRVAGTV
ncbi:hypothetical protein SDC9_183182 [bioreactor metagenome]|uniref:Uncharacterized protein n=1 Tax=bioreactor metagenome TaxID=1076179 RepID=A0A645HHV1_9ZZZZ